MLRLMIVGAGAIANKHLDVISEIEELSVTSVVSRTAASAKKLAEQYSIETYGSNLDSVVARGAPDAILIMVSPDAMFQVGRAALEYGVPVFFEKPPALSLAEACELADIASRNQIKTMVGLNRRFYSIFRDGVRILEDAGGIHGIAIEGHERFWKLSAALRSPVRERWLFANSIHTIDLLRFFGGEIRSCKSFVHSVSEKTGDQFVMAIEFESGQLGSYMSFWHSPGGWQVRLFGNELTARFEPLERGEVINRNFETVELQPSAEDQKFKPGFFAQMMAFKAMVVDGTLRSPGQSLEDSLKTMEICDSLSRSEWR